MAGKIISHYELEEILGQGGMGVVYRGRDLTLERPVAIKFLREDRSRDSAETARFIQEARAASALDHPNICTIYEVDRAPDGQIFIAMAYYPGETLRHKINVGALPLDQALAITTEVAQGLAKAHARHIVHRDIKPENIIITEENTAKIVDFGLAKLMQQTALREDFAGTVDYMAPEQIHGASDRRTDLWALGVMLFEMLTSRRPFRGRDDSEIMQSILHNPVPAIADVPEGVRELIVKSLAKSPAERYQTAEEMLAQLHSLMHGASPILGQRPANSIAVVPLVNVSRDQETEYFTDGLTDELIHLLSQVPGLLVVSRTSSFQYKGTTDSVTAIGDRLGVRTILEGSVRRSSNQLRVTVTLTDAVGGYQLWSQRYDRELKDLFDLQEDIALSIVSTLKVNLKENTKLRARYTGNMDAYALYLEGRHYWDLRTEEGIQRAGECYHKAIAIDPNCAPAYAGLADFYISLGFWSVMLPRDAWAKAHEYAIQALKLDSQLPEAEIALAKYTLFNDWDWTIAEQGLLRAIELDPGLSIAHFNYAILLLQTSRFESALLEMRTARELDPLSLTISTGVAWAHYYAKRLDHASTELKYALDLKPDYFEALACMGLIAADKHDYPAAVQWLERASTARGGALVEGFLGYVYGLNGQRDDARRILTSLLELKSKRYITPIAPALVHIGLAEYEQALNFLDEAFEVREAFLAYAKVFPPFRPLRAFPRFRSLLTNTATISASTRLTV